LSASERLRTSGWQALNQAKFAEAEKLFRAAEKIDRSSHDNRGLAPTLNGIAGTLRYQGRFDEARNVLREYEAVARTLADPQEVATCIGNCAALLREIADETEDKTLIGEALALAVEQEKIARQHEILPLVQFAIGTRALLRRDLGHLNEARRLFERQLAVAREIGRDDEVARCLANLANAHIELCEFDRGAEILGEAEALARSAGM